MYQESMKANSVNVELEVTMFYQTTPGNSMIQAQLT